MKSRTKKTPAHVKQSLAAEMDRRIERALGLADEGEEAALKAIGLRREIDPTAHVAFACIREELRYTRRTFKVAS